MLVTIKFNSRFMLLIKYIVFLYIHIHLIQSVLFCAIYLCHDYIYFKLHHYVCLLNSHFLLAALVHCSCILIGQFHFRFFVFITKF